MTMTNWLDDPSLNETASIFKKFHAFLTRKNRKFWDPESETLRQRREREKKKLFSPERNTCWQEKAEGWPTDRQFRSNLNLRKDCTVHRSGKNKRCSVNHASHLPHLSLSLSPLFHDSFYSLRLTVHRVLPETFSFFFFFFSFHGSRTRGREAEMDRDG